MRRLHERPACSIPATIPSLYRSPESRQPYSYLPNGPLRTNSRKSTESLDGVVGFNSVQNLTGGTGVDAFVFNAGLGVTGSINGGGGGDWLDCSAYTTPVTVNLAASTANGAGSI